MVLYIEKKRVRPHQPFFGGHFLLQHVLFFFAGGLTPKACWPTHPPSPPPRGLAGSLFLRGCFFLAGLLSYICVYLPPTKKNEEARPANSVCHIAVLLASVVVSGQAMRSQSEAFEW